MPVTISIPNGRVSSYHDYSRAETPSQLLRGASSQEADGCKQIIQSSFSFDGSLEDNYVMASRNGLVWSAFEAYSSHHHLTIRPEDIWFAIVTQLSTYINANSEMMRDYFVSHEGQMCLEVINSGTLYSTDFGDLAQQMTIEIAKNINDPSLREWVLPSFSTTTENDKIVGSVLLMGAMQKYFSYGISMTCGIPSVTLLGEVTDYEDILKRLDKLDEMGKQPIQFAKLLRPILQNMILSFTQPSDPAIHKFWNQIANMDCDSGSDRMTGWITAFCYWDYEGRVHSPSRSNCTLGGLMYPYVDTDDIPCGYVTVPVEVNDNGTLYNCKMIAGSLGMQAVPGLEGYVPAVEKWMSDVKVDEKKTGIKPVTGWMIYEFAEQTWSRHRRM